MTQIEIENPPVLKDAEAARSEALTVVVSDPETCQRAGSMLVAIKGIRKKIDEFFDPVIRQAHETHRSLCGRKKMVEAPVEAAERHLKGQIGSWTAEQERKRREAEAKAREEARKAEEDRVLREAAALEAKGKNAQAAAMLEKPIVAPVVVVQTSVPKMKGVSTREVYRARVVDFPALVKAVAAGTVPIDAVIPDETFLRKMAGALKKNLNYPGVEVEIETITAGRAC